MSRSPFGDAPVNCKSLIYLLSFTAVGDYTPVQLVSGAEVAGNAGDLSVFTGSAQQTAPTSEAKEPTTQNAAANCGNEEPKVDGECVLHTLNTILDHYKMPL
jgi:hypothetical protein